MSMAPVMATTAPVFAAKSRANAAPAARLSSVTEMCIRDSFSPFPHGTGSLSVTGEYSALEGGPPGFVPDFTCPALLGCRPRRLRGFAYGALTRCGRPFHAVPVSYTHLDVYKRQDEGAGCWVADYRRLRFTARKVRSVRGAGGMAQLSVLGS